MMIRRFAEVYGGKGVECMAVFIDWNEDRTGIRRNC